jgi:hypothetical protein
MVLSVTVLKSENERAQPINRPRGPRNCTGRAPFSEKFSGDSSCMGATAVVGFGPPSLPSRVVEACACRFSSATGQWALGWSSTSFHFLTR